MDMVIENMQKVQNIRKFLALLAEDDKFRLELQQSPERALEYLSVLGNSAPKVTNSMSITLPSKEEVRRALEHCDFALEHTSNIVQFEGWGSWSAWAAWVFVFLAKTDKAESLN